MFQIYCVHVNSINPSTALGDFSKHFAKYGEMTRVFLPSKKSSDGPEANKGYGSLTFVSKEAYEACLKDKHVVRNQDCKVVFHVMTQVALLHCVMHG